MTSSDIVKMDQFTIIMAALFRIIQMIMAENMLYLQKIQERKFHFQGPL